MIASLQVLFLTLFFYFLLYGLGWGLSCFLFEEKEKVRLYSPWIGIALSGIVSIACGLFGIGSELSFWISAVISAIFCFFGWHQSRKSLRVPSYFPGWLIPAFTLSLTVLLMSPVILNRDKITSFTLGNNDLFDYCVTAQYLKKGGLRPYLKPFGQNPEWENATLSERVVSWQIPAPRWLSYYPLSFLSTLSGKEVPEIFSLYTLLLYALFLPILWLLAKEVLNLQGGFLWLGFLWTLVNPHILTIAYHGFLPQLAATGFFLCFFSLFPSFMKAETINWRKGIALSLFAGGVLASYLEIYSFLIFTVGLYSFWKLCRKEISWAAGIKKLGFVFALQGLLCPYPMMRFISILLFHSAQPGGGWRVTQHYYLIPFQLGLYFSRPPEPSFWLEWILNPILLFLTYLGIKRSKEPALAVTLIVPFLVAGAISFFEDWNYRYFKNFTYLYYWVPLLIVKGADTLISSESSLQKKIGKILIVWIMAGILLSASGTWSLIRNSVSPAQIVPEEMKVLNSIQSRKEINPIYFHDLNFWETLWASYFLREKNVLLSQVNPYLRNDTLPMDDPRIRFILTKKESIPKGFEKIISESGVYVLLGK
ncbi:MAG: hypothetical protein HYS58_03945 [Elusimicrobia bacterium]|nr:hypothetical protein [Elusimicrobiota bacterium]